MNARALDFADTPRTRCDYYRRVCHLPTRYDHHTGRIRLRADLIRGLMMPSELGQQVKTDLDQRSLGGGPIIAHPRSRTWTFLIRSDIPATFLTGSAALWLHRVTVLGIGAEIALPSPTDRGMEFRAWVTAAHSTFRPSGMQVLDSVRRRIGGQRL